MGDEFQAFNTDPRVVADNLDNIARAGSRALETALKLANINAVVGIRRAGSEGPTSPREVSVYLSPDEAHHLARRLEEDHK